MIIKLCEKSQEYTGKKVEIVYYQLKNTEEALNLFKEINIDSHKNQFFITQDLFGHTSAGHWRGIYKKFYGSDKLDTHPWEMLGFSVKPYWWDRNYNWTQTSARARDTRHEGKSYATRATYLYC